MISNTERCLSYQKRQVGLILIAEGKTHSLETYGGMHTHTKGCCKVLKKSKRTKKIWVGWVGVSRAILDRKLGKKKKNQIIRGLAKFKKNPDIQKIFG